MTDTDVLFVRQGNLGKATLNPQTSRAKRWVKKYMYGFTAYVDAEAVEDLQRSMEHDNLKVEVR